MASPSGPWPGRCREAGGGRLGRSDAGQLEPGAAGLGSIGRWPQANRDAVNGDAGLGAGRPLPHAGTEAGDEDLRWGKARRGTWRGEGAREPTGSGPRWGTPALRKADTARAPGSSYCSGTEAAAGTAALTEEVQASRKVREKDVGMERSAWARLLLGVTKRNSSHRGTPGRGGDRSTGAGRLLVGSRAAAALNEKAVAGSGGGVHRSSSPLIRARGGEDRAGRGRRRRSAGRIGRRGWIGLDRGKKRGGRLVGSTLVTRRVAAAWGLMDGTAPLGFRVWSGIYSKRIFG